MQVQGLDHVNIRTPDVPSTARFFADALGMTVTESAMKADISMSCWVCDSNGHPILHVGSEKAYGAQPGGQEFGTPASSGRIHHVALKCTGFDQISERLGAKGIEHRINNRNFGDLRQIFVTDPNGIQIELNFAGD